MAVVGAYNFNALLPNGKVPDKAGYSRDLTLDSGVALTAGHDGPGLQCDVGGATATYVAGNYMANGRSFSCFAWVKSLSSTHTLRVIAENRRTGDRLQSFYLSNANGNLSAYIGLGTPASYDSGVSVLDGGWHHVGVAYNGIVAGGSGDVVFWVDGEVVATFNHGVGDEAEFAGSFAVGRATSGSATQIAGAVIDDLRWFNDPVYVDEMALFEEPVKNLVTAAYSFDEAGSAVIDATLRHNNLALTGSGSRATAVNNDGLYSSGSWGAEGDALLWEGGAFDRLSVMGWVKITTTGSAAPFISLEDDTGTPKFQLFRGGALGLLMKAWGDQNIAPYNGEYVFTGDGVLSTSEWRYFYANINPTGSQAWVFDESGTRLGDWLANSGNPPTNEPIISGVSRVRLGGGVAALDDVRIVRNYLNEQGAREMRLIPVTQEPAGVLSNIAIGDLSVAGFSVGDATVSGIALGDTLVFGA